MSNREINGETWYTTDYGHDLPEYAQAVKEKYKEMGIRARIIKMTNRRENYWLVYTKQIPTYEMERIDRDPLD